MKTRQEVLVEVAKQELAEHELGLGLEHLRAAATRYEEAGSLVIATDIRDTLEALRKRVIG